ncbi:hypothetical protein PtB15_2B279 [Puccinia triticina]|nr:hypothetical protein PtB15_2B279 [Puccinia triticina]
MIGPRLYSPPTTTAHALNPNSASNPDNANISLAKPPCFVRVLINRGALIFAPSSTPVQITLRLGALEQSIKGAGTQQQSKATLTTQLTHNASPHMLTQSGRSLTTLARPAHQLHSIRRRQDEPLLGISPANRNGPGIIYTRPFKRPCDGTLTTPLSPDASPGKSNKSGQMLWVPSQRLTNSFSSDAAATNNCLAFCEPILAARVPYTQNEFNFASWWPNITQQYKTSEFLIDYFTFLTHTTFSIQTVYLNSSPF